MRTMRFMWDYLVRVLLIAGVGCTGVGLIEADAFGQPESEAAPTAKLLPAGALETTLALPYGESPEGIALDRQGNIYVTNRIAPDRNDVLKIGRDGTPEVFAALGPAGGGAGLLGLATDPAGRVYAAYVSRNPAKNGVWRIDKDGSGQVRIPGSEGMVMPNALAFDARGNLYATDSQGGAVYRMGEEGVFELWTQHELLEPLPFDPFPMPLPGANGIAFCPPDILYVANTEKGLVVEIRIRDDGGAGAPVVVSDDPALTSVDGIAVDAQGHIYGVIPPAELIGIPPVFRLDPKTGDVAPVTTDAASFDFPTSLAFGRGGRGQKSVFVVNSDLIPDPTLGAGPGVVQVGVGAPGYPIR